MSKTAIPGATRALDTSAAAERAQVSVYQRMTPSERVDVAMRMSEDARLVCLAGIRARHPEYDGRQTRFALLRLLLGDHLFRRAFVGEPLLVP